MGNSLNFEEIQFLFLICAFGGKSMGFLKSFVVCLVCSWSCGAGQREPHGHPVLYICSSASSPGNGLGTFVDYQMAIYLLSFKRLLKGGCLLVT